MRRKSISYDEVVFAILRVLSDGSKFRFSDMIARIELPRASVSRRIKDLEVEGYVLREVEEKERPPRTIYSITPKGLEHYKKMLDEKIRPLMIDYHKLSPSRFETIVKDILRASPNVSDDTE